MGLVSPPCIPRYIAPNPPQLLQLLLCSATRTLLPPFSPLLLALLFLVNEFPCLAYSTKAIFLRPHSLLDAAGHHAPLPASENLEV